MTDKLERYVAKYGEVKLTPEIRDFMSRRSKPFLDGVGLSKSLENIVQEAYMQGMRDAVEVKD